MTIASLPFLGFALLAALLYNAAPGLRARQAVFLAINLLFLATFSHDPLAWLPFAGFLGAGYAGVWLLQTVRARWFWPLLGAVVVLFFWLKKYAFLPSATFLTLPYVTIGISYIFFRVAHLLIDAHDGQLPGRVSPVAYLNYTLNFTSLVSVPI